MELPTLDGFSVARDIRNQNGQTPILFISGNNSDAYRQQCLDAGGETLMPKPLRPSELRRWLEVAFSQLTAGTLSPSGAQA